MPVVFEFSVGNKGEEMEMRMTAAMTSSVRTELLVLGALSFMDIV